MNINKLHNIGTIFTVVVGSLCHFLYDWSGNNEVIALFSAVNESVWEHLKLIFFPMMLFAFIEYKYYGTSHKNFISSKFISVLAGMIFIVISFYTLKGIFGKSFVIIDISMYIIAVIISYKISLNILQSDKFTSPLVNTLSLIGIAFIAILFIVFTFNPPKLPIFQDSTIGMYGIPK